MRLSRPARTLVILTAIMVMVFVLHVGIGGSAHLSPLRVLNEFLSGPHSREDATSENWIVWHIRLPRCLACVLVGGILGVVGSAFQAQLRNPIAEPYVIGVSSGAAIGGAIALKIGWEFYGLGRAIFGFFGGIGALLLVVSLAMRKGVIDRQRLILTGVLVGSQLSAILTTVLLASKQDTNQVLNWLFGEVSRVEFVNDIALAVVLVVGTGILMTQTRRLNALAHGEATAQQLGVNVNQLTYLVLAVCTAMTSMTVGTVGIIGFLGLVAPHVARRVVAVDWRWSLPGSLVCGAILLCVSDIVAQRGIGLFTKEEIEPPVGLVTALLGAPVLMVLLKRKG